MGDQSAKKLNKEQLKLNWHQQAVNEGQWWTQFAYNKEQAQLAQEEDRRRYYRQLQDRVADAKSAGLHPLFALGAGGGSSGGSFIPGQAPSGSFATSGLQLQPSQMGAAVADAAQAIGSGLQGRARAQAAEVMDSMQMMLMKSQLEESQTRSVLNMAEAHRAQSEAKSYTSRALASGGGILTQAAKGALIDPNQGKKAVTPYGTATVQPYMSAQQAEDRWGDIAQEVVGLANAGADVGAAVRESSTWKKFTTALDEALRSAAWNWHKYKQYKSDRSNWGK